MLLASTSNVSKLPRTHSRAASLPPGDLTVNTDRKRSERSAASLPKLLSSVMTCGAALPHELTVPMSSLTGTAMHDPPHSFVSDLHGRGRWP